MVCPSAPRLSTQCKIWRQKRWDNAALALGLVNPKFGWVAICTRKGRPPNLATPPIIQPWIFGAHNSGLIQPKPTNMSRDAICLSSSSRMLIQWEGECLTLRLLPCCCRFDTLSIPVLMLPTPSILVSTFSSSSYFQTFQPLVATGCCLLLYFFPCSPISNWELSPLELGDPSKSIRKSNSLIHKLEPPSPSSPSKRTITRLLATWH